MSKSYSFLSAAASLPLDGSCGITLADAEGLGYVGSVGSYALSGGFRMAYRAEEEEETIAASLCFREMNGVSCESRYRQLLDFVLKASSLRLGCTVDGVAYYRDVAIKSIQKSDDGSRITPVVLLCLSAWVRSSPAPIAIVPRSTSQLRYTYRFTANARYGNDSPAAASALIQSAGHEPAALSLSLPGELVNPVLTLRGQSSGKIYGRCRITGTVPQGSTLLYSSEYANAHVRCLNGDGSVTDLLPAVDLSSEPFFRAPVDENSLLELNADGDISGAPTGEIYYCYRGV